MSWHLKYCEPPLLEALHERFTRRYARWFTDPEEARADVLTKLLFERLPATEIKHQDSLDAFVFNAMHFVVLDLKRKLNGRAYYPDEIEAHGEPIKSIYEAYCFEAKPARTIAEELHLLLSFVRECIARINAKKWCRERRIYVHLDDETLQTDNPLAAPAEPFSHMNSTDLHKATILHEWWIEGEQGLRAAVATFGPALAEKIRRNPPPTLTDQDRNILRLTVAEGKTHEQAGQLLNMPASTLGDRKLAITRRFRAYLVEMELIER